MSKPENADQPQQVTLREAKSFIAWLSKQQGKDLTLPTLAELKAALASKNIAAMGPEWTSEGWIYNPANGTVDKKPGPNSTAGFRAAFKQLKYKTT